MHGIVDAVLALLDLDTAHLDHGHAASELGEA